MSRMRAGVLLTLACLLFSTGCRTADAVRDGISAGISDTVATLLVALLLPDEL